MKIGDLTPQIIVQKLSPDWTGVTEIPDGALDDSRGPIRVGLIAVGLFFGLFVAWAAFAPFNGAAVAPGTVSVAGNRQVVQSLNGGMIDEVLVEEGQRVAGGQILVRLNGVASDSRTAQSQNQQDALRAAEARLAAERDRLEAVAFPQDLTARASQAYVGKVLASQEALFAQRKRVFDADRAIAQAKVDQASAQRSGSSRQLALIREELGDIQSLYTRGYAPKSRVLALQRAAAELETGGAAQSASVEQARQEQLRGEEQRMSTVLDELREVQAQLGQVEPQLTAVRYSAERNLIRAPLAGRVVGLSVFGPGAVASPGQKILEVLPEGRALIVQARVRPQDIDDVRVGAEAHVRLTTVNPHGRSSFVGKVTTLSADRLSDPRSGEPYYLAVVAVNAAELREAGVALQAGLPATINITTHERTFLDYLVSPLSDALSGSMREE